MEVESLQPKLWEGYVDWRSRPAVRGHHGGMFAATFVMVVEVLENLAFLANASNLVVYLAKYMHMSPATSANSVTNFMGTAFLLALLGGFLSDAFFTTFHIYLLSALIEFLGLMILTVQAQLPSLRPPENCNSAASSGGVPCREVHGSKAAMLFVGLYLAALGVGGIKGSLPSHGAEQFDDSSPKGRKQRSTFFTYFVFCLSCGGLIAVTLVVWVEDNKGWQWGFGISTFTVLLSIPIFLAGSPTYRNKIPSGSPLTTIAKVIIAAITSTREAMTPSNIAVGEEDGKTDDPKEGELTESLGFLNRAALNKPVHAALHCSVTQVEDVKIVVKMVPIFCCTIMLNCCLAQLSTFSVQQAATMDTKLGSLTVPPASLPVFPILFIMLLAPVYDHLIIPFSRKLTKSEMGISHLRRIGVGLVLSVVAMATAALVEMKRKRVAAEETTQQLTNNAAALPITFLWIAFQYLFLGSADLFTLAGLLEFFFAEAPEGMKSLATALSFASLAMGYYLSSAMVSVVNSVTGHGGRRAWLSGESLKEYHLDWFYWVLCVLSTLNFLHYLVWSCKLYEYRTSRPPNHPNPITHPQLNAC